MDYDEETVHIRRLGQVHQGILSIPEEAKEVVVVTLSAADSTVGLVGVHY